MKNELVYEFENDTLIIKKCPNNILNYDLMCEISQNKIIKNIILLDGIEKIDVGSLQYLHNLKKISLPNTLKIIESSAFEYCKQLKEIKIPNSVEFIGSYAFKECYNLSKVSIPGNVKVIAHEAFCNCKNLNKIIIEEGVNIIEWDSFSNCEKLKHIKLPSSIRKIGARAFQKCSNLRKIVIPEGVEVLDSCFIGCKNLKKVTLPNTLKIITNYAFQKCSKLRKIKLPDNLEIIGQNAFSQTGLWSINIPGRVKSIGEWAFENCHNLFVVKINEGVEKIKKSAFYSCDNISSIDLPDTVNSIEESAFEKCFDLRKINLSKNLIVIRKGVFSSCNNLKKVIIPEGIKKVELSAFNECYSLNEIHFPSTVECINKGDAYLFSLCLDKIFIKCKDGEKEIDTTAKKFIDNNEEKLFLFDKKTQKYSFYNDGEYLEFDKLDIENNTKVKKMIGEQLMNEKHFIRLYYWLNKKIIPGPAVIRTMPIKDIDKFFVNKNCNEWSKLVKESGITYIENVKSFFKLCYVLGVFSESTSLRDKAVEFIRENIIGKLNGSIIHSKFDGFELSNGFNQEYAEFFIKYYNDKDFMKNKNMWGDDELEEDLMAASYNNFKQVKKIYPNKTLHTNRTADLLLPEHVINAVSTIEYENIEEGNEEFSVVIGRYGYSNDQFAKLQEWYNKAKNIKKEEMKLFISKDEESQGITYKLLNKDDQIGAVLGNITNCCQVVGGQAESCVKYGMTMPNSGFITFNYKDKIIGQSWVWYDEKNKTVCLDNIEVPHKHLEKISESEQIQVSFINCLLRVQENFKREMNNRGLDVVKVTIGKGYNDIGSVLKKNFLIDNEVNTLSKYDGYSDATNQYVIKRKS